MTDFATERWRDPIWLAEAVGWATDRLAEHGHTITGELEQAYVRAWSTVLRRYATLCTCFRPARSADHHVDRASPLRDAVHR